MDDIDLAPEFHRLRVEFDKTKNYAAALARGFCELKDRCPDQFVGILARNGLSASHIEKVLNALVATITEEQRKEIAAAAAEERAALKQRKAEERDAERISRAKKAIERSHRLWLAAIAASDQREAAIDRQIADLPAHEQAEMREFRDRLKCEADQMAKPLLALLSQ